MKSFEHTSPTTIQEAVKLLSAQNARVIAAAPTCSAS